MPSHAANVENGTAVLRNREARSVKALGVLQQVLAHRFDATNGIWYQYDETKADPSDRITAETTKMNAHVSVSL